MIIDLWNVLYMAAWIVSCVIISAVSIMYIVNWWLKK